MERTDWMTGRFGLMNHWLFPGVIPEKGEGKETLDGAVDAFNVDRLLADVADTGADWLIFTLGQNSGTYISPNPVIEALCGAGHCSRRDLALEIAQGLHRMGKRFIAYLPCEVAANTTMHTSMAWNAQEGSGQYEFQDRYTSVVRAWAERFGDLLDGWWFDGCYTWPIFHNQYMEWDLWYTSARAGNPMAALAFNDGSLCVGNTSPVRAEHDYLSGETEMLVGGKARLGRGNDSVEGHLPSGRYVAGTKCQWHSLLPVDCFWMHGAQPPAWVPDHPYQAFPIGATAGPMEPPIYYDEELGQFLRACCGVGGAVTFNVGVYQEGHLGKETVKQLGRIGKTV